MIKSNQERIASAEKFATAKHKGQTRIGGDPYISHPIAVAKIVKEQGYGTDYQITALFHDLLEDTDASEEEIRQLGGPEVLEAVRLLTKQPGCIMSEYVQGILSNPIARAVKAADRLHNLRSAFVAGEDFKRKYILETVDWYLKFSPEIPYAVKQLVNSLEKPLTELPLVYEPIETWLQNKT
ncbi:MAG: HD domain-containing protein [Oliverpabstia sp.]